MTALRCPAAAPRSPALTALYRARLEQDGLVPDVAQAQAVVRLEHLARALETCDTATPPKGVYLYGPVGRGKSMVMNLFYGAVQVPKRRVHFHAFMQEVHERMHAAHVAPGHDLMQHIAGQLASEAVLLCFDEFYITNIADAMLLGRLFEALTRQGVVMVATSNWPMEGLFQGGINRDRFVPFIRLMQQAMEPLAMGEGRDYRVPLEVPAGGTYLVAQDGLPLLPQLEVLFRHLAADAPELPLPAGLVAKRRHGRTCWFTFASVCEQNLGADAYLALAEVCDVMVLEGVPVLTAGDANAALRLVTLVDIWYERGKRLVVGAAAPMEDVCVAGDAAEAFRRTVSRLRQMTQAGWGQVALPAGHAMVKLPKSTKPHVRKSRVARDQRRSR